jgi:hypothetical protein
MANFLGLLDNPQINSLAVFDVMKDFRKGGLNPSNYQQFLAIVNSLPPLNIRTPADYLTFLPLRLVNLSEDDTALILKEASLRNMAKSKQCWHPLASPQTCSTNQAGEIVISAAHSLQNNGVLNKIAENGEVVTYRLKNWELEKRVFHKNNASIFYGFCNTHDAIFDPIEKIPYEKSLKQNFLFAYRAFCIAAHKKIEGSLLMNFEERSDTDLEENRKIFNQAILTGDFDCIETEVIELPALYPFAVSSAFYLDFDFSGNELLHSRERMEFVYITLLPVENKTYFLFSWLKKDSSLYSTVATQLQARNNLFSDISVLIAGHCENLYFNPIYFKTFIEQYADVIPKLMYETQMDAGLIGDNGQIVNTASFTPKDYLSNKYQINFFGY